MKSRIATCLFMIPLSFAFYAKYKQDRIKNATYRSRIITIHLVQLPFLIYVKS